jgi:hypothetical protein
MARFEVTSPDGQTFTVEHPSVRTREEAISFARSQYEQPDLGDTLAQIDQMRQAMPQEENRYDPEGSSLNYLGQQLKKGVAATVGMPVDAVTNALNLGIAGYGLARGAITGDPGASPEPIQNPVGGSDFFERMFLTNNDIKPTSKGVEVAGRFVRDAGAMAAPGAAIASRAAKPLASLGTQAVLSGLASTGGETARALAPEEYKDAADMAGTLIGGVAVPAFVANRIDAVNSLRDVTSPNKVNRFADDVVRGKIAGSVQGYPGAVQNLDDAARMEQEIPGLKYRVGQASGVPTLVDMERRVATSGPEQFNKRALQDQAQQAAIRAAAEKRLPLLTGNTLDDQIQTVRQQRQGLAEALPTSQADDVGQTLRAARNSMKGRYDQIAAEKFTAPVKEAERLNVRVDPSGIIARAQQIQADPILKFDATNAPAILSKVDDLGKQPDLGGLILGPNGKPIRQTHAKAISFSDLKAMREAVNQDIAREATSMHPNARQRLRALMELRNEIDYTAQQTPEPVKKLWADATKWYRDVYAPKFLRGVNLRQNMKDITGDLRIPDEKLAAQYFKPLGTTPMDRFLKLYEESPQAMKAMQSHILDTYRRTVMKDGVLDPKKHDVFMRNYGAPLKKIPQLHDQLKNLSSASAVLAERETQLVQAQKILSQGELAALKYDALPDSGLDPNKINSFLRRRGDAFLESVGAIYGKQAARDHLENLKQISKAAEVAERGMLPPNASPSQAINPMGLQGKLGFTGRTVFSMIRAVTTGRTSPHDVAYTLGAQTASHRISQALIAAEERAISDPETAKLITEAIKHPMNSTKGQLTLKEILAKGGLYLIGGNKFADYGQYRAAPFAVDATQAGSQED